MPEFDYIIVGAGSAGCVLANRLSTDGAHSVLLIEAGKRQDKLFVDMPKGVARVMGLEEYNWFFPTEADPSTGYPGETWVRGKAVGGSSTVNALVYNRGEPADYDALEALGCTGWNWRSLLPFFRQIERHAHGGSPLRGGEGPLPVSVPATTDEFSRAVISASVRAGLTEVGDVNGPHGDGVVGAMPHNIHRGRRWSSVRAFLDPALARRNLTVVTETEVERVVFEEKRAVGVACTGKLSGFVAARREVILSAGALASPLLLQLSGIGPGALLGRLGIAVVAARPQVGANLREHRTLFLRFRLRAAADSQNRDYCGIRLYLNSLRYLIARTGVMAEGSCPAAAFFKALPDSPRPDAQALFVPFTTDAAKFPVEVERAPGMSWIAQPLRPQSAGVLRLRSADPHDALEIIPNYLSTDRDRNTAIATIRFLRHIARQEPIARMIEREIAPGNEIDSDEAILDAWYRTGACGWHACGTCRMGSDVDAVVDPALRVNGVDRLRVVDASVFPELICGNTHAAVVGLAARGSDIILGREA